VYERINQFGHWFLTQGVTPGDLVALYMQNSPDFIFAWLGLWSIGAAPAMINFHLTEKALIHCLRISGARLVLIDDDPELIARIEGVALAIENELGLSPVILNSELKTELYSQGGERPDNIYRENVRGNWPVGLFYTRSVPFHHASGGYPDLIVVAQRGCQRQVLSM
jgi:acyl-CoA synthetase (AMP-forming)/AMP-acid ligase II